MLKVTALKKVISSSGNSQHGNLHKELLLDIFSVKQHLNISDLVEGDINCPRTLR